MGYSHYWNGVPTNDAAWAEIQDAARKIIAAAEGTCTTTAGGYHADQPVEICDGWGNGRPMFAEDFIMLNGDETRGLDYETFVVAKHGAGSEFCKTARKPYDVVVTAILAYLAAYHGYDVQSDGTPEEWQEGVKLANEALGIQVPNPILVNELTGN